MSTHIPQLIDSFYSDFERTLKGSASMLFSGKFGSGKTYFLNHYFELEKNKSKYLKIYTQPSAYYHAADGDVLGYLKYDILAGLLQHTDLKEFQKEELGTFGVLLAMMKGKGLVGPSLMAVAILSLFFAAPASAYGALQISKLITTSWAGGTFYSKARKRLEEEKASRNADGNTRFQEYQKMLGKQKDSLFEESAINDLILALLKHHQTKVREDEYGELLPPIETVLIVDDLDRMLPDACLGFLNMLSTHVQPSNVPTEQVETKNLYFFDKVVIVGYDANILAFIEHTYGANFDATGYMHKICNGTVFIYDPFLQLIESSKSAFLKPLAHRYEKSETLTNDQWTEISETIYYVVQILISANLINIRDVFRIVEIDFEALLDEPVKFKHSTGIVIHSVLNSVGIALSLITIIFGSLENAKKAFNGRQEGASINADMHLLIGTLLLWLDDPSVFHTISEEPREQIIKYGEFEYSVGFGLHPVSRWRRIGEFKYGNLNSVDSDKFMKRHDVYRLFKDVILQFSETPK